jgi:hypothetical protein
MKKTNKINPITFFRKANEARQAVVKKSMKKAQDGMQVGPMTEEDAIKQAFSSPQNDPVNDRNRDVYRPTPMLPEMPGPIIYKRGGSAKRKR